VPFDPAVVKSYDIRGIYPDQIDDGFAYLLGTALPGVLPLRSAVVGHDCRPSSPALFQALAGGLHGAHVPVASLGMCPTEFVYYAVGTSSHYDLGVMITASHNPPEYNGFKVVGPGCEPVTGPRGLGEAFRLMQGECLPECQAAAPAPAHVDPGSDYLEFALDLVGVPPADALRLVVDPGNGVGGLLWDLVAPRLGCATIRMNYEPDGSFPAHHPDPSKRANLMPLVERVAAEEVDAGLAYDGDADRVVVVTRGGHVVDGSEMTACIAHRLLQADPGCRFGVGQTTSRKTLDYFRTRGVEPFVTPVGHAKIKDVLRSHPELVFAGEDAGHYYYRDFFCCDSSLLTTLHLLHLLGARELEGVIASFASPWHRPEREPAIPFDDQEHALVVCRRVALAAVDEWGAGVEITCELDGEVLRRCGPSAIGDCDGVRVDHDDWWFCVRPSGTEPIARLAVEARALALLDERTRRLLALFDRLR
jgi:phosphomannomutase